MIYTPENVRIHNGFAIFTASESEQFAIRLTAIESVKVKYSSVNLCWDLTVRTNAGVKHRFDFSAIGGLLDLLIQAG